MPQIDNGRPGKPADQLDAAIASADYNEKHDAALRQAREIGVRAVPSVDVRDRLYAGLPTH
jgi:predicted DsbA family dithiol-disulfide isomerase